MSGSAVIGGLFLGTVGAAAGNSPVSDATVEAGAERMTLAADVFGAQSFGEAVVVDVKAAPSNWAAGPAATTTTTAAPAPTTTSTTAPAPAPEPEPEPAPAPAAAPAPEPEPAPAPAPSGSAEEAIAAWFPEVYDKAVRVANCESSMNPGAVSGGGGNHGLFQINNVHQGSFEAVTGQPWSAVYDAYYNSQFARHLYDSSGWGPWGCRGA